MRLVARIYRVEAVATIPVDCQDADTVREYIKDTAERFPDKLNFEKPKKNEKIIVQIEQVG